MSRLFISHSSMDNVVAKAFKQWLGSNGWPDEDVFLDLDSIGAGERWKEALRRANMRCEAVILLASPQALASPECITEVRTAENYGKEIVVVLLHDVHINDRRLDAYKERQIVNLVEPPRDHVEVINYQGENCEVRFSEDALAKVKDYLLKRGITPEHFPWPPQNRPDAEPFPGLSAFTEEDAGIFFGRDVDISRGLDKLRIMRRDRRPRVLIIQAASGAGKSSYLRAGLWPRLERDQNFAPMAILRPAKGILTGPNGLGRKLAAGLSLLNHPINPGDIHARFAAEEPKASAAFREFMVSFASQALERRLNGGKDGGLPALIIAVDQAEELFASEDEEESERFLYMLGDFLRDPPRGVEPIVIFTVRADSAVLLFQVLAEQQIELPEILPLLSLPNTSYRDIILKPLHVLAGRGQKLTISPELAERLVQDSDGADALPLLAFTLAHLYQDFGAGGAIGLQQYEALGGVAGSIELALKRALSNPGNDPAIPAAKDAQFMLLRAAFIPWLARISPETGLPMRRVARLDEFPNNLLAVVERLIGERLLVVDRREGADVVEIAHESLLRQWRNLNEWLEEDVEKLKVLEGVDWAAAEWVRKKRQRHWLEHRGARLRAAERIVKSVGFRKRLGQPGLAYLEACRAQEWKRKFAFSSVVASLVVALAGGVLAWRYEPLVKEQVYWFTKVRSNVLSATQERDLVPFDHFRECVDCPEMVVIPAGRFMMGAAKGQGGKDGREYPQHEVRIASDFAIGRMPVTFSQFTACAENGDCDPEISSNSRDDRPAVNVTWYDAKRYVIWLSRITGKSYRLLSEAEYEYAARGGKDWQYPWGDQVGKGNANCGGCDVNMTHQGTTPVGSFPANGFGLHDMVGNVFEWVTDCFYSNYDGAPVNGSARSAENCPRRVVRGASWLSQSSLLRSSWRDWRKVNARKGDVGFRVARSLTR